MPSCAASMSSARGLSTPPASSLWSRHSLPSGVFHGNTRITFRVLLVAVYWRTNLTMRQLASLCGVSKSKAYRVIDHLGPKLALQLRRRFAGDAALIVHGTLVPTRDHKVAEQSKNHRYSTNHQVVIDADTSRVVVIGKPLPGKRNGCRAWAESGAKAAVGKRVVIADGGYPGTGLVMPHRRSPGE